MHINKILRLGALFLLVIEAMIIISGGQTGVDRAALDVAIELGISHGGFVPKGRLAEDGPLSARYQMTETASPDYSDRTKANVDWGDATLIFYRGRMSGGTLLTWEYAKNRKKPVLAVDLAAADLDEILRKIRDWLATEHPSRLNIAGPRESGCPGMYIEIKHLLSTLLS